MDAAPVSLSNTEPALRHAWHPVSRAADVGVGPVRVVVLGEAWVLVRLGRAVRAFRDRCPHRRAPLSLGTVGGWAVRCTYQGWSFDAAGACTAIPALGDWAASPPRARLEGAAGVAERHGWVFRAVSEHVLLNREDPGVAVGLRPLLQRRGVTYRVSAPFHLVLRLDLLDAGGTNVIGLFLQPEIETTCWISCTLWRDDLDGDPLQMAVAVAFEQAVLAEGLAVREACDQRSQPLGVTDEVHARGDRSTIELRRLLADLVAAATGPTGDGGATAASDTAGAAGR